MPLDHAFLEAENSKALMAAVVWVLLATSHQGRQHRGGSVYEEDIRKPEAGEAQACSFMVTCFLENQLRVSEEC